ncbi:hypothetical protein KW868_02520 [Acinetobacter guillouiae]|uniref:Uncharacterized protein n=1 Tax=Acinetobacter guillouiae TaxID=106649 RepID=A0A8X8KC39_ACIGI|nr:hypothetical protein [Acinetobacter guillouiae]MCF0263349.1 hypothetical protein [Acinetobacter guillouiae]
MEIKEIPTLEQKQAFWAEQLPNFESKYWLPSHFEFLAFDMDQGNYVIKEYLDPSFEDDATEIFHRVNTGWAMWKKAIKFTEKQATPEGFVLELEKGRFVQYELIDLLTRSLNSSKVLKTNTNWVHVVRMLNVGSTVAHRICEKLGVDPESTKFEAKELSHD